MFSSVFDVCFLMAVVSYSCHRYIVCVLNLLHTSKVSLLIYLRNWKVKNRALFPYYILIFDQTICCGDNDIFNRMLKGILCFLLHLWLWISGVTILLSLTVFSQVLADTMPATSDAIPLLGNLKWNKRHPPQLPTLCMPSNLISMWTLYITIL